MRNDDDFYTNIRRKKRRRNITGVLVGLLVPTLALVTGLWLHHSLRQGQQAAAAISIPPATTIPTQPPETEAPTTPQEPEPTDNTANTPPQEVEPVQALLDSMSLDEKICQLFIVRPEDLGGSYPVTQVNENLDDLLMQYPVGGVVFFGENILDREQCISLIDGFQNGSRIPLFVCVDEEGGLVSRVGSNSAMGTTPFPEMGQIGRNGDPQAAYNVGYTIGSEIRKLGFNLDFAPVADVNTNPNNPIIGSRAFSSDPETAAVMAEACVKGFQDAGVISCLKHFPGHGDTDADSHTGYVSIGKSLEELTQVELVPFLKGIDAGVPVIMAGHIACPGITDDELPASLSPVLIDSLLRQQLGYTGVIVTDAMDMSAIADRYTAGEAAVLALQAGCDMVLIPADLDEAIDAVRQAVKDGTLTTARIDESVFRILKLKEAYGILVP